MNSLFVVFFVACAVVIGLWLLTDDDAPATRLDDAPSVPPAKDQTQLPQPMSKSA